jgi:hypothetical protein
MVDGVVSEDFVEMNGGLLLLARAAGVEGVKPFLLLGLDGEGFWCFLFDEEIHVTDVERCHWYLLFRSLLPIVVVAISIVQIVTERWVG